MDGLGLNGQYFQFVRLQTPPQVQLVDFPFLELGHPGQSFRSPGCDCRWCGFSLGFSLIGRARQDGFLLVVRCAIDSSSSEKLK
jgi:hypothetical protein